MEKFSEHNAFSETLKAIRSKEGEFASLEKRKQTLTEMKAALIKQQQGLGLFIKQLYELSYENTPLKFDAILGTLEKFSQEYNFSEDQLDQINSSLKGFWRKHSQVEGEKALFEDKPEQFFEECFGQKSQDKVKIIFASMTITFILFDRDYNFAYSHNEGKDSEEKQLERAQRSGGAAFSTVSKYKFPGIINIVRATQERGTIKHEDQHQFNKLFVPQENRGQISQEFLERTVEKETTQKARRQKVIFSLAKNVRKHQVDPQARDEILSQLRNHSNIDQIYDTMVNNSLYKYFNENTIRWKTNDIQDFFSNLKSSEEIQEYHLNRLSIPKLRFRYEVMKSPSRKEIEPIVESAYKSYYTDLKEALEAAKQLQGSGLTNQDIVPLLQAIPLDRWKIFARRFLNQELQPVETLAQQSEVPNQKLEPEDIEAKSRKWYERLFDYKSLWPTKGSGRGSGGHG